MNCGVYSWIKAVFRTHFGFSKAEVNGTLALLLFTCLCLLVSQGLKWYYHMQPEARHEQDIALLEQALAELTAREYTTKPPVASMRSNPPSAPCCSQKMQSFDINTADEASLRTIKGIGPVLAARIVKYCNQLGGFISQEQYQEVYGLRPEVVANLKKHTYISVAFRPTQLNINTADAQTLAAHPYLTYQQARSIINYRVQHGPFTDFESLNALVLIDNATLEKLNPYLCASP